MPQVSRLLWSAKILLRVLGNTLNDSAELQAVLPMSIMKGFERKVTECLHR